MNIFPSPPRQQVVDLLAEAGLPTSDLSDDSLQHFLGCGAPDDLRGIVGLEILAPYGLLRSLVVAPAARNAGCAKALVRSLEEYASRQGIEWLYLLTETAEDFFLALGYAAVDRKLVPDPVRETEEFSSLCPGSATVMRKPLR